MMRLFNLQRDWLANLMYRLGRAVSVEFLVNEPNVFVLEHQKDPKLTYVSVSDAYNDLPLLG